MGEVENMDIDWKTVIIGFVLALILAIIFGIFAGTIGGYIALILAGIVVGYMIDGEIVVGVVNGAIVGLIAGIIFGILILLGATASGGATGSLILGNAGITAIVMTIIIWGVLAGIGGAIGVLIKEKV